MGEGSSVGLGLVYVLLVVVMAVAVSVGSGNVWVGLLCLMSLGILSRGWLAAQNSKYPTFMVSSAIGLGVMAGTGWSCHFSGRWVWTPLWLFSGALFLSTAGALHRRQAVGYGLFALFAGALSIFLAVAGPWMLAR
ncbi:MAG: hypothetical protein AB1714_15580 [Acidobacteriota bacterium]